MKDKQLIGDLFREALYSSNSVPEVMETFSDKITSNYSAEDFFTFANGFSITRICANS